MQDYSLLPVRTSAILTNSYVAGTVIGPVYNQNQLILLVTLTYGTLTDARIKIEFSPDGTNYYQETFSAISSGTSTDTLGEHKLLAGGNYRIALSIKDKYIKVSALGTGVVVASAMGIDAIVGIQ
jgi:hypothetical protein